MSMANIKSVSKSVIFPQTTKYLQNRHNVGSEKIKALALLEIVTIILGNNLN